MRKLIKRTTAKKLKLIDNINGLVATGMTRRKACKELGVAYATMLGWLGKNGEAGSIIGKGGDGDFPIVSVSPKSTRPSVKKEKVSGKAIVIITDISSLSSVLSSL